MRRIVLCVGLLLGIALSSAHPQGQRGPTISEDLKAALASGARVRVIVQAEENTLSSLRFRLGRGLRRNLAGALSLDVTASELSRLTAEGGVAHLSGDLPVVADVAITNQVTRADKVWAGQRGLLGLLSQPSVTGQGIGVAVIDSGIAEHNALTGRVVARVNLVSHEPGVTGDPFGHGTHIAGLIGGSASAAARVTPEYAGGSAPGVHFVDVRVLGSNGSGYTSDVIAGIDWTIANARRYGIRVVNLSLGHPVSEPSATDPLCRAVARATQAGLVVVVSAGNYGQTATGTPILGGITSPGNSPFAITVGALDAKGTIDRSDDAVAAYSSRGPTKFDFAVKPDVVAPGTAQVSLENPASWLSGRYPRWHIAGSGRNAYYQLSGTSMAAAVVSGGVALLLDSEPGLTPAQVKLALQTGAQFLPKAGLIAGGAGSVDFSASQRLTQGGLVGSLLTSLTNTLGLTGGASFRDHGSLIERIYDRTGIRLLNLLDLQALLGNPNGPDSDVLNLLGLSNPLGTAAPNYIVWGNVAGWSNSYYIVWGSSIQSTDGEYIVWGSADSGEYIVWGSGIVEDGGTVTAVEKRPSGLPSWGRAFVGAVGLAGVAVLAYCLTALGHTAPPAQWVAFSLLTFATGALTLKIPSTDMAFSMSEVFAFSCVLLYGPEMAAPTVAIDVLLLSLRLRHSRAQTIFNFGSLTLCVWVSGTLFFALAGVAPLYTKPSLSGWIVVPLALMAACYFLINSVLAAAIIGCHTRRSPVAFWREHFVVLIPTYAAGASVSLLLVVALRQVHYSAILLIPPLLLVTYLTMRASFGRLEDSKRHVEKLNCMYLSTVETLATAIDAKDEVTHGHIRRVQFAAVGLAREIGVTDEDTLKAIEAGALLHDTGKIAVPEHILNKPGKLTAAEFEKMKLHAPIGAEILSAIDFPYPVVPIVRHHHENWDGTGYPDRIRGTDIPVGARILSVVDCFDALTSDRPYRSRMTNEAAIAILLERRGKMYDPAIVDAFIAAHERLMPAETPMHPAARAVGGARSRERVVPSKQAQPAVLESNASEEVLGITSLARALGGEASLPDVGALSWMMFKQVLPCSAMGLFVPDEANDTVVGCYAAGQHAGMIRGLQSSPGDGIVGWVAGHRRPAVNAEPALDFGLGAATMDPPLLSALAIPLVHDGSLVAVLSLYATTRGAFSEDHARLLELMAPKLAASIASVAGRPDITIDASRPASVKPKAASELSIVKRAAEWRPRVAAGSSRG